MLSSPAEVIRCLMTYSDWWQPSSSSVLLVGAARRSNEAGDGFRAGVLDTLDERIELCRRVAMLEEADRRILLMWYVGQAPVAVVARHVGISVRQVFRRRARAIQRIVELGQDESDAVA